MLHHHRLDPHHFFVVGRCRWPVWLLHVLPRWLHSWLAWRDAHRCTSGHTELLAGGKVGRWLAGLVHHHLVRRIPLQRLLLHLRWLLGLLRHWSIHAAL